MNELSGLAVDHNYGEKELEAVNTVFSYILSRKRERSFETLLSLSRLPKKVPRTFDNFDFSVMNNELADKLKNLTTLATVFSNRNLAFIGPPGTGKHILPRHSAMNAAVMEFSHISSKCLSSETALTVPG